MIYGKDYFGFVYIWHDLVKSKFLIGSHFGSTEDGYLTSTGGIYVKRIFKKRPETMKRRVLEYCKVNSNSVLKEMEQKWLDKRPNIAENTKYYNLKQFARGGIDKKVPRTKPASWIQNQRNRQIELAREGKHNFNKDNTRKWALQRLKKGTHHFINSDFNKKPFKIYLNGVFLAEFESKQQAMKQDLKAHIVDSLRKEGIYVVRKWTRSKNKLFCFKKGDILKYQPVTNKN